MTTEIDEDAGSAEPEREPEPETGGGKPGLWAEIRDAVTPRTFLLVAGTLALGIGFALSYVGALHNPRLQNLPITIVSESPQATQQIIGQFESAAVPRGLVVPSAGSSSSSRRQPSRSSDRKGPAPHSSTASAVSRTR